MIPWVASGGDPSQVDSQPWDSSVKALARYPQIVFYMEQQIDWTRNLGDAFHLVTFTVDPENDTPERLAAYASLYHASPARWTFLTGDASMRLRPK